MRAMGVYESPSSFTAVPPFQLQSAIVVYESESVRYSVLKEIPDVQVPSSHASAQDPDSYGEVHAA